ncbi:MAG: prepilin peptidase [Candidatus Nanosyncoccaceae bacterium]|jgi:prepilin signal peptidase PulO-like enzyme (type II secretory pathway)
MGYFDCDIISHMFWLILLFLFALGAASGSFVVASVWRIRADQLVVEKRYRDVDYKRLVKKGRLANINAKKDRSHCLSCGYVLRWHDLIPVVSWIFLGGKCRQCRSAIGILEIAVEIILGGVFVISYLFWPLGFDSWLVVISFSIWIAWLLTMAILFIYDLKWMELPIFPLYVSIGLSSVFAAVRILDSGFSASIIIEHIVSLAVLAGIYWLLYTVSRGRWVGSGDAFVGASLALILGDWRYAFMTLFLANLLGTLVVFPSLINKKISFSSRIPMGPLLIIAGILVFWFGRKILLTFVFL